MSTFTTLPAYESTELSALTEQQLLDLMIKGEDRVPRNVIEACASRDDAMITALRALVSDEVDWHEGTEVPGKWWLRLHAIMILGLMNSDAAGSLLLAYMRRMDYEDDENLEEWFMGYWHALFANKPAQTIEQLKEFAEDNKLSIWIRHEATDAYVFWFREQGGQPLEAALDWLAGFITDNSNEMDFRLMTGNLLLEYPRPRFRIMLEKLASEQTTWSRIYDEADVARAFERNTDESKRDPFNDPWSFYAPSRIAERQKRWQEEDEAHQRRQAEGLLSSDEFDPDFNPQFDDGYEFNEPYIRDTPKIGRNDPCLCGSGKKYKKCCLGKEG